VTNRVWNDHSMSHNSKLACPDMNARCHIGMHFGKLVEVYASPMEYSCVVHNPEDLALIASWKMPMELSVHQAAAIAAFQTEERDYNLRQNVAWTA
jgi:hypothetical protein